MIARRLRRREREFTLFRRFLKLLEPRERRSLLYLLPLILVAAGFEVLGVASVIPFLTVLADPQSVLALPVIGPLLVGVDIEDTAGLVRWTGLLLASVIVVSNLVMIAKHYWLLRYSWGLNTALSSRLLRHYLAQPYVVSLTRNTGAMTNKLVTEVRQVVEVGFRSTLEIAVRAVMIAAVLAFLLVLDPLLASAVFGALGLFYGLTFFAVKGVLRRFGREAVEAGAARVKAVNEALGGLKDLKVAGRERSAHRRFEIPTRRFGDLQAWIGAISTLPRYALEAIAFGGMVLIASLMAGREGSFVSTLPLLGAYGVAAMRLLPAMQALFGAMARVRAVAGSLEAIEADFLDARTDGAWLETAPIAMAFEQSIELRDVHFTYPGSERAAVEGVSIRVARGSSLAIVGRTGSGKTTLVDVLLGLLEPQEGVVMVDGVPITPGRERGYRRLYGYVPQSIFLIDDTISRNVAFGMPDEEIDTEAVVHACRSAQILDFIEEELPNGFDTVVGERGVRLSGGQRQRIGIARALYHQPAILVFDEATSALDVHTEHRVYEAFEGLARQHTIITIAHRLASVRQADRVVVLEHGRVVDHGTPDDVLARFEFGVGLEVS